MGTEHRQAPDGVGVGAPATETSSVKASRLRELHADELSSIRDRRAALGDHAGNGNAHDLQLLALAHSGGGLRSAAFALGVIQALAPWKLLKHFDYLFTIPGGSSIGSFLTAWGLAVAAPYSIAVLVTGALLLDFLCSATRWI